MERRKDLDFAKGIGIILMVLGHSFSVGNGEGILCWLYSFHMPLFFIIPGIVFGTNNPLTKSNYRSIIWKKAKSRLVPYFFFSSIVAIMLCIIGRRTVAYFGMNMWRIITLQGINAMWFIPCFLLAELLFIGSAQIKSQFVGSVVVSLAGVLAVCFPILRQYCPMVQSILIGCAFIAMGCLFAKLFSRRLNFPVWCALAVLHLLLALINGTVDLAYGRYGNIILYFLNGLLGTFVITQLYHILKETAVSKFLVWIGKNTIVVLCTSSLVIEVLRLFDYKLFGSFLPKLGDTEGIVLCSITMMLEVVTIMFCRKYLWFIFGERPPKHLSAV